MAITYNPYNWEIRPRKKTLEELKACRKRLIHKLSIAICYGNDQDEYYISKYIKQIQKIEEEIEKIYIKNGLGELVYI